MLENLCVPGSKLLILGMVIPIHPTFNRESLYNITGIFKPRLQGWWVYPLPYPKVASFWGSNHTPVIEVQTSPLQGPSWFSHPTFGFPTIRTRDASPKARKRTTAPDTTCLTSTGIQLTATKPTVVTWSMKYWLVQLPGSLFHGLWNNPEI